MVVEAPLKIAVRVTVLPLSPAVLAGGVTRPENGFLLTLPLKIP